VVNKHGSAISTAVGNLSQSKRLISHIETAAIALGSL